MRIGIPFSIYSSALRTLPLFFSLGAATAADNEKIGLFCHMIMGVFTAAVGDALHGFPVAQLQQLARQHAGLVKQRMCRVEQVGRRDDVLCLRARLKMRKLRRSNARTRCRRSCFARARRPCPLNCRRIILSEPFEHAVCRFAVAERTVRRALLCAQRRRQCFEPVARQREAAPCREQGIAAPVPERGNALLLAGVRFMIGRSKSRQILTDEPAYLR